MFSENLTPNTHSRAANLHTAEINDRLIFLDLCGISTGQEILGTKKATQDTGAAQMKTGASGDCADVQTKSTDLRVSAEKPCYKKWMEFTTHCNSGQTPNTEHDEQLNFIDL